jgi:hypothetical protein
MAGAEAPTRVVLRLIDALCDAGTQKISRPACPGCKHDASVLRVENTGHPLPVAGVTTIGAAAIALLAASPAQAAQNPTHHISPRAAAALEHAADAPVGSGDNNVLRTNWCDMFISWIGTQAGVPGIGVDAFTPTHARWFRQQGRWGNVPQPGAVVFFSLQGRQEHRRHRTRRSGHQGQPRRHHSDRRRKHRQRRQDPHPARLLGRRLVTGRPEHQNPYPQMRRAVRSRQRRL